DLLLIKENKIRNINSQTVAQIGDSILVSGIEEKVPFVQPRKNPKLHILLISPIGTIIDSSQVRLNETGLQRIYTFPITEDLFSGSYVMQIDGDFKRRDKINIKTNKQLLNRWIFSYGVHITNPNNVPLNNFVLDVTIPPNISPIQQVTKLISNFKPSKLLSDKDGNRWLRFSFPQISPNETIKFAYRAFVITRLIAYDITRIKNKEEVKDQLYPETYSIYTKPEPFIESTHPSIQKIVSKFSTYSPLGKIFAFLKFIKNNFDYIPLDGDFGPIFALENRYGDCTEFATLFVSLCRAAQIPARLTTSIILNELEGWEYHSQAEFFTEGIWFPIDPTLQQDIRYLYRNPNCIILQRGNTLGDSPTREIRYCYDNIENLDLNVRTHKEAVFDKNRIVGKVSENLSEKTLKDKGSFFEHVSWNFSIPSLDLEQQERSIEIKAISPETAPIHKPFSIPVHLYNRNNEDIIGTLRVSFVRGGIYTSQLYSMRLEKNSHEPKMIEIPATNFLGSTLIELIFQDENGGKIGYEQKKILFQ
ncbi:MAG: transglutaminase domain-containing protein, partial [Candidatus Heimdallarchaeota archaeon]|nr:transglutaminase domain-containing protein [Candidatus Heimdallarchaeota archaeon]MCK4878111.1 transglutaminase domain-containing protein [Candidatus Heimdallarchaeota archaeon]